MYRHFTNGCISTLNYFVWRKTIQRVSIPSISAHICYYMFFHCCMFVSPLLHRICLLRTLPCCTTTSKFQVSILVQTCCNIFKEASGSVSLLLARHAPRDWRHTPEDVLLGKWTFAEWRERYKRIIKKKCEERKLGEEVERQRRKWSLVAPVSSHTAPVSSSTLPLFCSTFPRTSTCTSTFATRPTSLDNLFGRERVSHVYGNVRSYLILHYMEPL